jgi:catechol 2,3-dioxygenase-like lactoylglutathione lyase family enzyme
MIKAFNHLLLPSPDAKTYEEMRAFYRSLGLEEAQPREMPLKDAVFSWFLPGSAELHLMVKNEGLERYSPVGLNPSAQPHYGYEVDDVDRLKADLEAAGHAVSTADAYGFPSRRQIYVTDPAGNVIEFVQYDYQGTRE